MSSLASFAELLGEGQQLLVAALGAERRRL